VLLERIEKLPVPCAPVLELEPPVGYNFELKAPVPVGLLAWEVVLDEGYPPHVVVGFGGGRGAGVNVGWRSWTVEVMVVVWPLMMVTLMFTIMTVTIFVSS
jgi:hypothetical protein